MPAASHQMAVSQGLGLGVVPAVEENGAEVSLDNGRKLMGKIGMAKMIHQAELRARETIWYMPPDRDRLLRMRSSRSNARIALDNSTWR